MQTVLTLAGLRAFDPTSSGKRFCCPLPACAGKSHDAAHRTLSVGDNGLWHCFRCDAGGQLREFWKPEPKRLTRAQKSMAAARKAFG